MIKILEELDTASNLLRTALDRYLSVCSALRGCYLQRNAMNCFPRQFSHRITDELLLVSSYETRINEAKVTINLARNSCTDIVPIDSLPDEILSRIFHLILDTQLSTTIHSTQPVLNHIDISSLVCSRWRRVSISLGTLWSHIDLNLSRSSRRCLDRAAVYAARASDTPLDVRILDTFQAYDDLSANALTPISLFLESIALRIRSLTLKCHALDGPYPSILRVCFASCIPGVFTRLVFDVGHNCGFLEAVEGTQTPRSQSIAMELPKRVLEDLLLHITALQVGGLYLPWTSRAYYGLTRLHLLNKAPPQMCIPGQQLIEILKSSPQLRFFHFGLKITDPLPADISIVPAHLECLEVLVWESKHAGQLGAFLRLIAPGSKPLQVSIERVRHEDSVELDEMKRFFARSNVTKLRMGPGGDFELTLELLDSLPSLEVLVLQYYFIDVQHFTLKDPTRELSPHSTHPSLSCFRTLHLIRCHTHLEELQRMVRWHSVQTLTVRIGEIFSNSNRSYESFNSVEEINEQLRAICPGAKFIDREEDAWTETIT